jgi:hypothetical protein
MIVMNSPPVCHRRNPIVIDWQKKNSVFSDHRDKGIEQGAFADG